MLFLVGGSAGTGIAELISQAMALEGMDIREARGCNALFDINGLLVTSRTDLPRSWERPGRLSERSLLLQSGH